MPRYANVTRTQVVGTTVSTQLLPANGARKRAYIYNGGATSLYVGLGPLPVSGTNFTHQVASNTLWEVPFDFLGDVFGVWIGPPLDNAQITEVI